jgi:small subunit ribosomal protein S7
MYSVTNYIPEGSNTLQERFINSMMERGKKSTARRIFKDCFLEIGKLSEGQDPERIFEKAIENVKPTVEVRSRRVGGATYQVPVEVKPARATALGLRWIVDNSRERREKSMAERLGNELIDASNGLGAAVKKREDTHKMAEANKAFAHYRW